MRGSSLAALLLVASVVCVALAIFYLIPGPYHPLTFSGTPTGSHKTHALAFLALAVFAFLGARFARSSAQS
jgi:amino acid permease